MSAPHGAEIRSRDVSTPQDHRTDASTVARWLAAFSCADTLVVPDASAATIEALATALGPGTANPYHVVRRRR